MLIEGTLTERCRGISRTPAVKAVWLDSFYMEMTESELEQIVSAAVDLRKKWIDELEKFLEGKISDFPDGELKAFQDEEGRCGKSLLPHAWIEDVRIPHFRRQIDEYRVALKNGKALLELARRQKENTSIR